mmetsp:Transcript_19878/g.67274  ORF Transcript_19878/g.67274 Transcript_19878/m.67274 type:complete len:258 (-) Transcript_19878:822-1595(-)
MVSPVRSALRPDKAKVDGCDAERVYESRVVGTGAERAELGNVGHRRLGILVVVRGRPERLERDFAKRASDGVRDVARGVGEQRVESLRARGGKVMRPGDGDVHVDVGHSISKQIGVELRKRRAPNQAVLLAGPGAEDDRPPWSPARVVYLELKQRPCRLEQRHRAAVRVHGAEDPGVAVVAREDGARGVGTVAAVRAVEDGDDVWDGPGLERVRRRHLHSPSDRRPERVRKVQGAAEGRRRVRPAEAREQRRRVGVA